VRVIATVDEDLRPNCVSVGDQLRASMPPPMAPVLQHGDFRLGNTLAREGRVLAVIDWEIWTVGDPRVDLAWYLMSTHSSKQRSAVRDVDGMPSDEELVGIYKDTSGLPVADLRWFEAFTQFKAAAITGQIIKHNRRSDEPNTVVSSWDPDLPPTFLSTAAALLAALAEKHRDQVGHADGSLGSIALERHPQRRRGTVRLAGIYRRYGDPGPDLSADRDDRREANPVKPVVDAHRDVAYLKQLIYEEWSEAEREQAMCHRGTERPGAGPLLIHVNPLPVVRELGEPGHVGLLNAVPWRFSEVAAGGPEQLVERKRVHHRIVHVCLLVCIVPDIILTLRFK
jgi:hypothetical protein